MYYIVEKFWNGACYEVGARNKADSDDLDEVIAEVESTDWAGGEDADLEIDIKDEDGDVVFTHRVEFSKAKSEQESEWEESWESKGEFVTEYLAFRDGDFYEWTNNGGYRGAHDRMDGSGRWIEHYEAPSRISAEDAAAWLNRNTGMDEDEIAEKIEELTNAR